MERKTLNPKYLSNLFIDLLGQWQSQEKNPARIVSYRDQISKTVSRFLFLKLSMVKNHFGFFQIFNMLELVLL